MTETEATTATTNSETGSDGSDASDAPAGYSRGERQKPVTDRYRRNWDAIFGGKNRRH